MYSVHTASTLALEMFPLSILGQLWPWSDGRAVKFTRIYEIFNYARRPNQLTLFYVSYLDLLLLEQKRVGAKITRTGRVVHWLSVRNSLINLWRRSCRVIIWNNKSLSQSRRINQTFSSSLSWLTENILVSAALCLVHRWVTDTWSIAWEL